MLAVIRSVPPSGIASRAFTARFRSAISNWFGSAQAGGRFSVDAVGDRLGQPRDADPDDAVLEETVQTLGGEVTEGLDRIKRLVVVDQKPIGRTPRSNLATYTGLLDHVRKLFAATRQARARKYDAGRFAFNVAKGRCETREGEGCVCVELLFLPSVYTPCPTCKGACYNAKTLEIKIRDKSIADVLGITVDAAFAFFSDHDALRRSLSVLREVGLGYIRLGQSATELSGGEAQRVKLATELQRAQRGGDTLRSRRADHRPAPVRRREARKSAHGLVDAGNTVVLVEHDMTVAAGSDWIVDVGPGAGDAKAL